MPRNHNPGTLRNRNRITNKTRLKVIHGNIDADPLVLEEDEEKARVVSTAGVDAEDANEHHLQAVLSAASQRHTFDLQKSRKGAADEAYIPIPDSAGVVDDYDKLYPPNRWKDPSNYVRSSDTVDDAISGALSNGFTYYMDERDAEWLEKNNEEARGEGTSAQGAVSATGTTTRSGMSSRSARAKGKEPDVPQPVPMTEDEFELVMGVFEKVTHERTEFLHHSLETGMTFPAFSEYQDEFANDLSPGIFASFAVPSWVPPAAQLSRLARVVYPHWRERRLERNGHRIIPILNFDESDVKNESYICFRRREVKTIRKTRASQVSYSEKLVRLQAEFSVAQELAQSVLQRETLKRECAQHGHQVWEKRAALVEMKRKIPQLGAKEDEELLYDKERVAKKPKITDIATSARLPGLKLRTRDPADPSSPATPLEIPLRPRERFAHIQSQIERELARLKERDQQNWEDGIDNPYQARPVPYPERLFKYIISPNVQANSDPDAPPRQPHALRMRYGRGGRLHLDRRKAPRPRDNIPSREVHSTEGTPEEQEEARRLRERWLFDEDDGPSQGPQGPEEQDRVLFDDFQPKHLVHSMTLLRDQDHVSLSTDSRLLIIGADGRPQTTIPHSIKLASQPLARPQYRPQAIPPPQAAAVVTPQPPSAQVPQAVQNSSTPISIQAQLKKMQQPNGVAQMRISSNGGMRPQHPTVNGELPPTLSAHSSPTHLQGQSVNGVNGINGVVASVPLANSPTNSKAVVADGAVHAPENAPLPTLETAVARSPNPMPARPKSQNGVMPNAYQIGSVNGYGATYIPVAQNGIPAHSMQDMKSAFAGMPELQFGTARVSYPAPIVGNGANFNVPLGGTNFNLKLPTTRQLQWTTSHRPVENGVPNGSTSPIPNHAHAVMMGMNGPVRVQSANGAHLPLVLGNSAVNANRANTPSAMMQMLAANAHGRASPANHAHMAHLASAHQLSPHLHPSTSPIPLMAMAQQQQQIAQLSPSRQGHSHSPIPPSPSLQHQQAVQPILQSGAGSGF